MEHHTTTARAEAERLLGIAEKLLRNRDFAGCKEFAVLAQEAEPLVDGSDQILAVAEVLLASDKRIGKQHDWYSILQINHRTDDAELIKKQYRRFALLLHPDKNKFDFADSAFRLVADAWNVLSDPAKKSAFDSEFSLFTKIDLAAMKRQKDLQQQQQQQQRQDKNDDPSNQKLPVRRSSRGNINNNSNNSNTRNTTPNSGARTPAGSEPGRRSNLGNSESERRRTTTAGAPPPTFWTVCPYCYNLYEYNRTYEGCCLRCQNCERAFTGMEISAMPPMVPGKEAYHCCWGFFPMGFVNGDLDSEKGADASGFPNWMPPMFQGNEENNNNNNNNINNNTAGNNVGMGTGVGMGSGRKAAAAAVPTVAKPGAKKRGRPRKNVINV